MSSEYISEQNSFFLILQWLFNWMLVLKLENKFLRLMDFALELPMYRYMLSSAWVFMESMENCVLQFVIPVISTKKHFLNGGQKWSIAYWQ